jgi:hypothetical protein
MTTTINASPTNGLVQTADGSGVLKVQSNGVTTNALAWVNFNGTGTVAIRSSYNVSSITDNGTGDYTVNFATALSDANYSVVGSNSPNAGVAYSAGLSICYSIAGNALAAPSTSSVRVGTAGVVGGAFDSTYISVAIFGN